MNFALVEEFIENLVILMDVTDTAAADGDEFIRLTSEEEIYDTLARNNATKQKDQMECDKKNEPKKHLFEAQEA